MNNLYIVMVSLLSAAGIAALLSQSLPQEKNDPIELVVAAGPHVAFADTKKAMAKAIGKKNKKDRKPAAARVMMKRDVNRATSRQRDAEGNHVEVVIMNSGVTMRNIEDMQMIGSSGSPMSSSSYIGFDNVVFPFVGNIRFKAPNKLGMVVYCREVRFKVNEPGRWTLRVDL